MEAFSAKMYYVLKSAQGDFNQGNVARFGNTAGKKCTCNALFSLCWSVVGKASIWKSYDLDKILIKGNKIYQFLNKDDFLNVNELSRTIKNYSNSDIDINIELQNLHERIASQGQYFIKHTIIISDAYRHGYLILVVISSFDKNGDLSSSFLLDSNSRNDCGITNRKNGFPVLLQTPDLRYYATFNF